MVDSSTSIIIHLLDGIEEALKDVWGGYSMYPAWAKQIAHKDTVAKILNVTAAVLQGLNIPRLVLDQTNPADLVYYWRKCYTDNFFNLPPRNNPDANTLGLEVARGIAQGIYSMAQQSKRYRNFMNNGFPAGMPTFPEYVGGMGEKTQYVAWEQIANSCSSNRSTLWQSDMSKLPRRKQSMRASHHDVSDVHHPERFT